MGVSVVAKLPSVSVAGPSSSVKVGVSVVLKAQVAESFGSVSQYAWDNGKGGGWSDSSPTLSQATFSYAKRGVYSARLRVLGRGGMVDSASSQLTVWNDDPVLAGLHDTSVTTGSLLTLKATAGDPEGIRWYIWDVGADGQGLDTTTSSSRSFSMPVSPGTVRIAVAAQDGFDGITWDTLTVTVVSSVSAWAVRNQGTYLQSLGNVDFFTPARGYAIGKDPATSENIVLYTQDSGVTWSSRPITAAVGYLGAASFPDSSTGYVANGGNRLLKTTDGGATWSARNPNLPGVDAIAFVDAQRGWIVSSDNARVIRTVDGGASWTASGAVTAQRIRSIHFAGASTGWMCGTTGVLFKSVDGGGSWSSRNSGTVVNLNMIRFRDAQNGIAVGDGGVIRGSSDGGETWTTRSLGASGTSQDLTAVTWTGSHWIVVGNGGVVYSSLDGSTWTSHSSGTTKSLGSVTWTGSRIVAVGDAAVILSSP
jgi:photosystem II stability/assembly factor-like uncharacterized protein